MCRERTTGTEEWGWMPGKGQQGEGAWGGQAGESAQSGAAEDEWVGRS